MKERKRERGRERKRERESGKNLTEEKGETNMCSGK